MFHFIETESRLSCKYAVLNYHCYIKRKRANMINENNQIQAQIEDYRKLAINLLAGMKLLGLDIKKEVCDIVELVEKDEDLTVSNYGNKKETF